MIHSPQFGSSIDINEKMDVLQDCQHLRKETCRHLQRRHNVRVFVWYYTHLIYCWKTLSFGWFFELGKWESHRVPCPENKLVAASQMVLCFGKTNELSLRKSGPLPHETPNWLNGQAVKIRDKLFHFIRIKRFKELPENLESSVKYFEGAIVL